jgi:O-antigen/teichoic acid export membrane protein
VRVGQMFRKMPLRVPSVLGDGLKAKVFRGGTWLGAGSLSEQVSRFGRNMVLTRLLVPSAFGTMAIVLSAASLVDSLTEIGAKEALIQNPRGAEARYLNAAWWLAIGRGTAIYLGFFLLAPLISRFYGNPAVTQLIRISLLSVLFASLVSPSAYLAMKEMKFAKAAAINSGGGMCGIVITLLLAYHFRDARALALGYSAENAARCILSYAICPYCPRLSLDKAAAKELLQFSRGLFGLSFLNLIFSRADVFVLAKLYSPDVVGMYTMAIYLAQTPTSVVMSILGQCLLPAFAQIQGNTTRTNRILLQVTSAIAIVGLPAIAFALCSGRSLLTVVYGLRYGASATALIFAAMIGVVNLANSQITIVFYAMGRPQLHRLSVAVMAAAMLIGIYPLARWVGPSGGQVAALVAVCLGYLFQVMRVHRLTGLGLLEYSKSFAVAALVSTIVVLASLGTRVLPSFAGPVSVLGFGLAGCLVAYSVAGAVFFIRTHNRPQALG